MQTPGVTESRKFRAVKSVGKKGEGLPVECLARGTRSRTPRQKRVLLQYLPSGPQHLQEGGPQRKPAKAQHHQYHCERLDDQVADWQAHDFAPSRTSDSRTFLYVKQFRGPHAVHSEGETVGFFPLKKMVKHKHRPTSGRVVPSKYKIIFGQMPI